MLGPVPRSNPTATLLLAASLAACSGSGGAPDVGGGAPDAGPGGEVAEDGGSAPDADPPDLGEPDAGQPPPPDVCDDLQLPRVPMQEATGTFLFGDVAGDFSVTELDGATWTLSERWTGCESFTFLTYIPTTSTFEDQLFESAVEPLITSTPRNAHFFFLSMEGTEVLRRARVQAVADRVEGALSSMFSEEDAAKQRARFHFVVERANEVPGSAGGFFADYLAYATDRASVVDLGDRGQAPPPLPFVFAIDRDQRLDPGEGLYRYVGGPVAFEMAGYLPLFFDHKARIRDAQAAEPDVTVIPLLAYSSTTTRVFLRDVELPAAEALARFDTAEVDIRIVCHERNVFGCSEWDRIARVQVCEDEACQTAHELVRWITPYWRRGEQRWVTDASALLGLLRGGGRRRFRIELGPDWERPTPWEVELTLRLSDRGSGTRAVSAIRAFTGGAFDASYNNRAPFPFTPPATATRVELVVILSGHGQVAGNNCAEWCDHRHQFAVDGVALPELRHEGQVGSEAGCGPAAARGAPPGQWGNWAPERAYWCPGLPVEHLRIDLTPHVTPGVESTLTYSATFGTRPPAGGDIALEAFVVWYE